MSSNKNTDNTPISFWEFLKKNTCVVPIIQRDYAQGREDKSELRLRFFGDLIKALKEGTSMMLDFVYGCPADVDKSVVYPLDGQQRLTSLWLLHWYLAFKSRHYDENFRQIMKRFTYQTRTSSREFCLRMCELLNTTQPDRDQDSNIDVNDNIQSQPWFSRRFKQDATVQSMLRALSDKNTNSGFEQMLANADCKKMLKLLLSDDCPIRFYFRSTQNEGIDNPDDLYVKMNARGKKLTQFENFKAELFSYKNESKVEIFRKEDGLDFIKRHENQWANLFWTLREKRQNIVDHVRFEYFNRMALAYIVAFGDIEKKDKDLFEHINNHSKFSSIEVYKPVLTSSFKKLFAGVLNGITAINPKGADINLLFCSPYSFEYFPVYAEANTADTFEVKEDIGQFRITSITVPRLVRFYAASMYFYFFGKMTKRKGKIEFDKSTFNDWMIFSRNLFNYSHIDTYQGAKAILNLFNQINSHCLDIVKFLTSAGREKVSIQGNRLKKQFEEEIEKARKIAEWRSCEKINHVSMIRQAEMLRPFDGAIRFLFTNASGNYDWADFELKKSNLENFYACSNNYYENKGDRKFTPVALRKFISHIDRWENIDRFRYNSSYDSWYEILLEKPELTEYIHQFLSSPICEESLICFTSKFDDPIEKDIHEELVKSKFLHQTTWEQFFFKSWQHTAVVWRSSAQWKRYLLGTPRNRLLSEGWKRNKINVNVVESRILGDEEHFWGEDLYFDLTDNKSPYIFWWHSNAIRRVNDSRNMDVYLCHRNDMHDFLVKQDPERYAITVPYACSYEDFENQIASLLQKALDDKNITSFQ